MVAVVAVGLVGLGLAAPTALADQHTENATAEYDLTWLQQEGTQHEGPDSLRISGSQAYWVIHWPADSIGSNVGDPQDDQWEYLSPGERVDRNSIFLRTINLQEPKDITVKVAYYDVEEREVTDHENNVTTTERVAREIRVDDHDITINRGFVIEDIPLRQHDNETQVTMWVEGSDSLKWTFTHKSVATTQEVPFNGWGGLLKWAFWMFVAPIALGSLVALGGAKSIVSITGVGPQWGYARWIFTFGFISALAVIGNYAGVARILVEHPIAMSAFLLVFIFILMLETFTSWVDKCRFVKTELTPTTTPGDEGGVDIISEKEETLTIIDRPDEPKAVASPGLLPFLSRLFGSGAAPLRVVDLENEDADHTGEVTTENDPLSARVEVEDGRVDHKFYVHALADGVVDYKPEGWQVDMPDPDTAGDWAMLAGIGGALFVSTWLASNLWGDLGGLAVLGVGIATLTVRTREGYARVWPSDVHFRSARATALHLAKETDEADTIRAEREKRIESEVTNEKDIMDEVDNRDETLIDGMFGVGKDEEPLVDDGGVPSGDD